HGSSRAHMDEKRATTVANERSVLEKLERCSRLEATILVALRRIVCNVPRATRAGEPVARGRESRAFSLSRRLGRSRYNGGPGSTADAIRRVSARDGHRGAVRTG